MCTWGVVGLRRERATTHSLTSFLPRGWLLGFAQVHTNVPLAILRVLLLPNQWPKFPIGVWRGCGGSLSTHPRPVQIELQACLIRSLVSWSLVSSHSCRDVPSC